MSAELILYGHPFSSYTWQALIALYEKELAFDFRNVDPSCPGHAEELKALWPRGKFPLLVHGDQVQFETSVIVEYLDLTFPGTICLLPHDAMAALEVRRWDRVFDNYVMEIAQHVVNDALRGPDGHCQPIVDRAKADLDIIYDYLDAKLPAEGWVCGAFSMADISAAPALFYADWVHEIGDMRPRLTAYRRRLLARPSVARCVEDARPYRHYFPLGAPDRD
ncbi:glutathione S-transferase family protein [Pacificimonas sp. ICDLI1SI03]